MKVLIVADPIESLKPKTDTGLAMFSEAQDRGHDVYWTTLEQCFFSRGRVLADLQRPKWDENAGCFQVEQVNSAPIESFDTIWIRKDPPFDPKYISLCWVLSLEENTAVFVNRPSMLVHFHEKLVPFLAYRAGFLEEKDLVPTFMAFGKSRLEQILQCEDPVRGAKPIVSKPWLGHGGRDVRKWDSLEDYLAEGSASEIEMLQPFLDDIHRYGDRRVFFLQGKEVGHFVRRPGEGSIQANLSQGGSAHLSELSPEEKAVADQLGAFLKQSGLFLAGADFIGARVSEVNVTAPTGFVQLKQMGGPDVGRLYLEAVEKVVQRGAEEGEA